MLASDQYSAERRLEPYEVDNPELINRTLKVAQIRRENKCIDSEANFRKWVAKTFDNGRKKDASTDDATPSIRFEEAALKQLDIPHIDEDYVMFVEISELELEGFQAFISTQQERMRTTDLKDLSILESLSLVVNITGPLASEMALPKEIIFLHASQAILRLSHPLQTQQASFEQKIRLCQSGTLVGETSTYRSECRSYLSESTSCDVRMHITVIELGERILLESPRQMPKPGMFIPAAVVSRDIVGSLAEIYSTSAMFDKDPRATEGRVFKWYYNVKDLDGYLCKSGSDVVADGVEACCRTDCDDEG